MQGLAQTGDALRKEMAGAYDIVSFDPRGVGGSTRASCGLDAEDRELVNLRSWPGPDGEITENVARSRRIADACTRNGGAVLRSFTTANEVRDIDRFRRALGEEKLSAWGISYGTYVGAVYAQKYLRHTDRWVLDSSGDPDPARVEAGLAGEHGDGRGRPVPRLRGVGGGSGPGGRRGGQGRGASAGGTDRGRTAVVPRARGEAEP
ncbi:alpha/beta fold hydrolase [Streptomyces scopuliridis]|uniref:alpha/beta fold hydrolase n=1 Tax=Streptomyces scopuliridis TaxID=452529 RepID=UPI0036A94F8D